MVDAKTVGGGLKKRKRAPTGAVTPLWLPWLIYRSIAPQCRNVCPDHSTIMWKALRRTVSSGDRPRQDRLSSFGHTFGIPRCRRLYLRHVAASHLQCLPHTFCTCVLQFRMGPEVGAPISSFWSDQIPDLFRDCVRRVAPLANLPSLSLR